MITSDLVIEELKEVVARKFKSLKMETRRIALNKIEHTFLDFEKIVAEDDYSLRIPEAEKIIKKKKDSKILSAVLIVQPDSFIETVERR